MLGDKEIKRKEG